MNQFSMVVLDASCTLHPLCITQPVVRPIVTTSGTTFCLVFVYINKVEEQISPQQPGVPLALPEPLVSSYSVGGNPLYAFPPGQLIEMKISLMVSYNFNNVVSYFLVVFLGVVQKK